MTHLNPLVIEPSPPFPRRIPDSSSSSSSSNNEPCYRLVGPTSTLLTTLELIMMVLPGLDGRLAGWMQSDGGLELIFQGGQTCRQGRAPSRLKTPHRLQGAAESAAAAIVAAGWSCWAAPGEEPHGPSRLQLGCVCVSVYVGGVGVSLGCSTGITSNHADASFCLRR